MQLQVHTADKEAPVSRLWKNGLIAVLAVLVLGIVACQNNRSPAPTQQQAQTSPNELSLRVGETTFVDNIAISFSGVQEDSRCPTDVQCVWAGNARAALGVGPRKGTQGPTDLVLLNTNASQGAQSGESWGLRVTLVDLTPAPKSTQPTPPENYLIRLKVEALSNGD